MGFSAVAGGIADVFGGGAIADAVGTIGAGALYGGVGSALTGGNFGQGALLGGLTGGLGGSFGSFSGPLSGAAGSLTAGLGPVASDALLGGGLAALTGGNPLTGAVMGGLGGAMNGGFGGQSQTPTFGSSSGGIGGPGVISDPYSAAAGLTGNGGGPLSAANNSAFSPVGGGDTFGGGTGAGGGVGTSPTAGAGPANSYLSNMGMGPSAMGGPSMAAALTAPQMNLGASATPSGVPGPGAPAPVQGPDTFAGSGYQQMSLPSGSPFGNGALGKILSGNANVADYLKAASSLMSIANMGKAKQANQASLRSTGSLLQPGQIYQVGPGLNAPARTTFAAPRSVAASAQGSMNFRRGGAVPSAAGALTLATAGPVSGRGGGQDDLIPARLADGEYVIDADAVSALGDGSNREGARKLDAFREKLRRQKRSAPADKIPPKARSIEHYLKGGRRA